MKKEKQPLNRFTVIKEVGQWSAITTNLLQLLIDQRLTAEELRLLFYLMSKLDFDSQNIIEINQQHIAIILVRDKSAISKALKKLRELNILAKTKGKNKKYMFNPRYIFINGARELHNYVNAYEKIEDKKFKKEREELKEIAQQEAIKVRVKNIANHCGITDPKDIKYLMELETYTEAISFLFHNKRK